MSLVRDDRTVDVLLAPTKFCPRKLKPSGPNAKRYLTAGPLVGYMIACPACGFIELHLHQKVEFTESGPAVLVSAKHPMQCMHCRKTITVADRRIEAKGA